MRIAPPVELSSEQRTALERLARQRSLPLAWSSGRRSCYAPPQGWKTNRSLG